MRLPSVPRSSRLRMLTGTFARISRSSGETPSEGQELAKRARHRGEHDVVDGAAQRVFDPLHPGQRELTPIETPVGAKRLIDRRGRRGAETGRQSLAHRLGPFANPIPQAGRVAQRLGRLAEHFEHVPYSATQLFGKQFQTLGNRPRLPGRARHDLLVRLRSHQHFHQVDTGHAIDHAVVSLLDDRKAAALETFDHPEFPQRPFPIQLLRNDAAGQRLQLRLVPRLGQRGVTNVIREVEVGVVHPHRMVLDRYTREPLAIARQEMESRAHELPNALDIHATIRGAERARLKNDRSRNVLVQVRALEIQERGILSAQSVVGFTHRGLMVSERPSPRHPDRSAVRGSAFMTGSLGSPTLRRLMTAREESRLSEGSLPFLGNPFLGNPKPMRWERAGLLGILVLAAAVRTLRWKAVAVMFNDGPVFLALGQAIADGNTEQALSHPFHPLYSALIAVAELMLGDWTTAGVFVSVLCGTLAVGVLFAFVKRAHGSGKRANCRHAARHSPGRHRVHRRHSERGCVPAHAAARGARVVPREITEDRVGLGFLGGVAAGLAYLARPEGLGVALAAGALIGFEALRGRMKWGRAIALGTAIGVGASAVALPYMIFLRVQHGEWTLTQKKSVKVMAGIEIAPKDGPNPILPTVNRAGRPAERRVQPRHIPGHPMEAPPSEPKQTRREKALEGVFDTLRTHLRSLRYEGVALLLAGFALLGVRPVGFRGRFIGAIVGLYGLVLMALAANFGYVSGRHALPALTLTFGYVADGILAIADRLRLARSRRLGALCVAALLLLFVGIGLGTQAPCDPTASTLPPNAKPQSGSPKRGSRSEVSQPENGASPTTRMRRM